MKRVDSIGFRLPAIIICAVSIFVIALMSVIILVSIDRMKKTIRTESNITLSAYAKILDLWINSSEEKIDSIVADPHEMEYYIKQRTDDNLYELLERFNRIKRVDKSISDIIILEKDFTYMLDTTKNQAYKNPDFSWTQVEFISKLKANDYELSISPTTYINPSKDNTNHIIYMASGIRSKENNELLGILVVAFNFSELNEKEFKDATTGDTGGHIFLTDSEGNVLADPYQEHIKSDIVKNSSYIRYAISNENGDKEFKNEIMQNRKFFMSFIKIKYKNFLDWHLVLTAANSDVFKDISKIVRISIVGLLIAILIIISLILYILKPVTSLLKSLATDITKIANGDLSFTVPPVALNMKDEFGVIAKAIDDILTKFGSIIKSVISSSKEIDSMAGEVSNDNVNLSERTESQAASLEETASSMEEMASTIKSSAENSVSGKKSMMDSKEHVEEASSMVNLTTQNINEVLEASKKISDITKMIESIALQTNILALNAAVEAARAGEQGRGFAVVASEVRNLAQTTQTSVKDITTLITDVNEKINKSTDTANKSRELFTEVEKAITDSVRIMEDISSTSIEQQAGVDQINKAISEIDNAVQQNASLVQNSSRTSETLHEKSSELVKLMEYFKIKE